MFVMKSTHDQLMQDYVELAKKYNDLKTDWNYVADRINAKGGLQFLDSPGTDLTGDEIKKLLLLCHPDRHDGKPIAAEMTARLLELRKKARS